VADRGFTGFALWEQASAIGADLLWRAKNNVAPHTKVRDRLLSPLLNAGHQPPATVELRRALTQIDRTLTDCIDHARLDTAA